jgi:hypothetical protein
LIDEGALKLVFNQNNHLPTIFTPELRCLFIINSLNIALVSRLIYINLGGRQGTGKDNDMPEITIPGTDPGRNRKTSRPSAFTTCQPGEVSSRPIPTVSGHHFESIQFLWVQIAVDESATFYPVNVCLLSTRALMLYPVAIEDLVMDVKFRPRFPCNDTSLGYGSTRQMQSMHYRARPGSGVRRR